MRIGGALALLALLSQAAAGLVPMLPLAGQAPVALRDLCLAANSPLAQQHLPGNEGKAKPGDPARPCQICLTLQLSGHFLPPAAAIQLPYPVAYRIRLDTPETNAPALIRYSSTAPRGPPAAA
jgi:hypothetical protein